MIEKLKKTNELMIKLNKENEKILKRHLLIKDILKVDNCFLQMSIEYAYSILRDLGIKEDDLKNVYCELIKL